LIEEALLHLPGIGPERARLLRESGIRRWGEMPVAVPETLRLSQAAWTRIDAEVRRCRQALAQDDLSLLVETLATQDHWRILGRYFEKAAYFDLETTGLDGDSEVTLIACYHKERLYRFVKGENLDGFLELLDEIPLLVSFNGSSFDVPRVLGSFHIPELPCPHIDLRWVCYHEGHVGGLKKIECKLGIQRPRQLQGVNGLDAVRLWEQWTSRKDRRARDLLERYCSADVLALKCVAAAVLRKRGCAVSCPPADHLWQLLGRQSAAQVSQSPPMELPSRPVSPTVSLRTRLQARLRQARANAAGCE
jgi:uncharacterized protein YprB with RNaseH-like and TPR domain